MLQRSDHMTPRPAPPGSWGREVIGRTRPTLHPWAWGCRTPREARAGDATGESSAARTPGSGTLLGVQAKFLSGTRAWRGTWAPEEQSELRPPPRTLRNAVGVLLAGRASHNGKKMGACFGWKVAGGHSGGAASESLGRSFLGDADGILGSQRLSHPVGEGRAAGSSWCGQSAPWALAGRGACRVTSTPRAAARGLPATSVFTPSCVSVSPARLLFHLSLQKKL